MDDVTIRPAASRATKAAPASSFTGTVLQDSIATPHAPSRTSATLVTFTPGARTNWHTHKTRQVLVATQGTGMVQVKDKPPRILQAGDVAVVPPGLVTFLRSSAGVSADWVSISAEPSAVCRASRSAVVGSSPRSIAARVRCSVRRK